MERSNAEIQPRGARSGASIWLAIGVAVALIATAAVIAPRYFGGNSSAQEGTFLRDFTPGTLVTGGYSGWVGAKVTVGNQPIQITHLARLMVQENTASHSLKIVDAATNQDLPGSETAVTMAGHQRGKFVFAPLAHPVTLQPNTSYYLVSSEAVGKNTGDFFYDHDTRATTSGIASIDHPIFWEAGGWRRVGADRTGFGPLNFRYRLE